MRRFRSSRCLDWRAIRAPLGPGLVGLGIWIGTCDPAAGGAPLHLRLVADSSRVEYHISFSLSDVTNVAGLPTGEVLADSARGIGFFGLVNVNLRDLTTGIGMRDRHVKSDEYLDVDGFPFAELQITGVVRDSTRSAAATSPASFLAARVHGTMRLHGVQRDVEIPVELYWQGDRVRVRGAFSILLADYGIKRPKRLLLSAGESVEDRVDLLFAP